LRPHIVWFGEEVPALDEAITLKCDYFAVIGTSYKSILRLDLLISPETPIFYIDQNNKISNLRNPLRLFLSGFKRR
jgi:NAD-dependent deacetylase